ncbi:MAG TPA: SulP family inorganic anion transporter [Candidatus Sulfopaludibacter sp.]|nr:SulP family inorganic anion transporter [Candidatus Sulfopaludibacter sp.]
MNLRFRYSWRRLGGDVSGGAIAALIALPYGLSMASMMGLPPVLGLVTSIATAPVTALLGRNPVLIGGAASATVPFISQAVRLQGPGGAAKVCMGASVFLMMFCVLKLGRYIQRVPHAVVTGFSCGIGAMMILSQLGVLLGVQAVVDRTSNNMLYQSWQVLRLIGRAQPGAFIIGGAVVIVGLLCARFIPRAPAPLLGVLAAVGIALLFGLHQREVGNLPLEIPPFAAFSWTPADVAKVIPAAFGLAFVSAVNLLITSRVVEHFRGRHRPMSADDADAELGAYGVANMIAGVFAAPMSVGIPARSLAAVRCGGSTRMANLFHGVFILAAIVLGSRFISHIPIPALAGVTAYIGICLLEWGTWRRLPRMSRTDALGFLTTAVSVLVMNAVLAVAVGCSFYLVRFLYERMKHDADHRLRRARMASAS